MRMLKRYGTLAVLVLGLGLVGCTPTGTDDPSESDDEDTATTGPDTGFPSDIAGSDIGPNPDGGPDQDTTDPWADSDKDGYLDRFDNCPQKSNPMQTDTDGDGVGDKCDNYKNCANKDQKKSTCEGKNGYDYDRDRDGDSVPDVKDNCPETKNKMQKDSDGDGTGDACETPPSEKFGSGTDSDGDGLSDKKEMKIGTDPNKADTDGDGISDGTEVAIGTDPTKSSKACGKKKYEANFVKKPIDIIFSIDTSGSMSQEIAAVERNINQNFASIIQNSNVDYRVIMLANKDEMCVQSPLATGNCGDGANTNTMRFKHIDQVDDCCTLSEQNWKNFLDYYDGTRSNGGTPSGERYDKYLRSNSFKVFVAISDEHEQLFNSASQPQMAAQQWDQAITGKSNTHFGTPSNRNYRFHSIVGVPPKGPMNRQAWQPNEPIQNGTCNNNGNQAYDANVGDEWASKMTGGLRYPVCETPSYDAVFKNMAKGVVNLSQIGCKLDMPKVGGKTLDPDKVALEWKPKSGSATTLTKVHDKSNCTKDHFFVNSSGQAQLCSSICKTVKNTKKGELYVYAGCENCKKSEEICDYKDNDCDGKVDEKCTGCEPEICTDKKDNDCDGKVNEGCCMKKKDGEKCSKDGDCCSGNCRPDGTCGPPCRPSGTSCASKSQCCSDLCAGNSGGQLGTCKST